jgi:NADH-quinone oxidoreductase subunit L
MTALLIGLTIGLAWVGALTVWLVGDARPRLQHILAGVFAIGSGCAAIALVFHSGPDPVLSLSLGSPFGNLTLVPDGLAVFLTAVAAVIGALVVVFSAEYLRGEAELGRYYSLVLLFIGAMCGLVLSGSMLVMFICWEITAFCSYALISFHNDDPKAVAGGIKALIMTQLGGLGLLGGALLGYAYFGDYEISTFLARAPGLPPVVLALAAYGALIAAAAKSAQVPFHTWLPDAMEAPTPVTALIHAATMVNAGVYLLARFYPAFQAVPGWSTAVVVVGLLSALLAGCMALVAVDLKRALAYSTVSQLGYMVYAVGAGGVFASQFHLMSHSLFKALLFLAAGAVIHAAGTRDMRKMGGVGKEMPFVRAVFVIGLLGLAGIPIANGFLSKELVLESGLSGGPAWAFWTMVLTAGLTACYGLRMLTLVFAGERRDPAHLHDPGPAMRVPLAALALGTLVTWALAGPFSALLDRTLPYHELHTQGTLGWALEVLTAPITWAVMAVVLAGLGLWWLRSRTEPMVGTPRLLPRALAAGLGFDQLNDRLVASTLGAASGLRRLQTGQLAWNVMGMLLALVALLAALWLWG